jgi:hypothetical protein
VVPRSKNALPARPAVHGALHKMIALRCRDANFPLLSDKIWGSIGCWKDNPYVGLHWCVAFKSVSPYAGRLLVKGFYTSGIEVCLMI